MILGRLFAGLFELGVVVVATSNVAPRRALQGRAQPRAVPAVHRHDQQHMEVVRARGAHRLPSGEAAGETVWYVPADDAATRRSTSAWRRLAGSESGTPQDSRARAAPFACRGRRGASPGSLSRPLRAAAGAADYLRIAHDFHTLILDPIPVMGFEQRNAAKRFIILSTRSTIGT